MRDWGTARRRNKPARLDHEKSLAASRQRPHEGMRPVWNPGLKQRVPAVGILWLRVEIDRPFDQGTVTFRDLAQTYGSFIANGRYQLRREVCRKRQRFNTGIGQRMDGVGMGGKALGGP